MRLQGARIQFVVVLVAGLAVAGCSKSKKEESTSTETKPGASSKAPEKPARETKPKKKTVLDLFTGKKPGMPKPMRALRLGMRMDEAKKRAPVLFKKTYRKLEGYEGVEFELVHWKTGYLRKVALQVQHPFEALAKHLTGLWGKGAEGKDGDKKLYYWDDIEAGIRVILEQAYTPKRAELLITPVMSLTGFLGTAADRFGFEKIVLLGAIEAQVRKEFGHMIMHDKGPGKEKMNLYLPLIQGVFAKKAQPQLYLKFKKGKVTGWKVTVWHPKGHGVGKAIVDRLVKRFGKPKKDKTFGLALRFKGKPKVSASVSDDQISVSVNY